MAVDPQLKSFVLTKKSKSHPKDHFAPTDLLACLEAEIKELYSVKLEEQKDEFDLSFAMSGKDQIFIGIASFPQPS